MPTEVTVSEESIQKILDLARSGDFDHAKVGVDVFIKLAEAYLNTRHLRGLLKEVLIAQGKAVYQLKKIKAERYLGIHEYRVDNALKEIRDSKAAITAELGE